MEQITINDFVIDLFRKKIKNIHLAVYPPTGRIRLAVPLKTKNETIQLFVISKLGWIKKQQRKFDAQPRILPREYKERESHYFQGTRYLLNIIETEKSPKVELRSKTFLELHIKPNTSTQKRHEILTEWYREQLKLEIPPLLEKWENILKINILDWNVKLMKTRWGSCNIQKKRILLNLELAKKPLVCLEYVIVHELLHLFERNHNANFKKLLDTYLPNWKQLKAELNAIPISN